MQPITTSFLNLLRATSTTLSRFGQGPPGIAGVVDPQVAKWWGVFTALAGVLEGQPALTPDQITFIRQLLFGGMGSFEELVLDESRGRSDAAAANQELDALRAALARALESR
jgi:hypothetical protein